MGLKNKKYMSQATIKTFEIGGQTISLETGRLARQADGAVVLKQEIP